MKLSLATFPLLYWLPLGMLAAPVLKNPLPVVIWHGLGERADQSSYKKLTEMIKEAVPNIDVVVLKFAPSFWDKLVSYVIPTDLQIKLACSSVQSNPALANGYNFIGFSQGGLLGRGLAQRCPFPRINNMITFGAPHQGVSEYPGCSDGSNKKAWCYFTLQNVCKTSKYICIFQFVVLQGMIPALTYFHDKYEEDVYRKYSVLLGDLNQERGINPDYKANILKLKNLVLVKFKFDEIVIPPISAWFGFYNPKNPKKILPMQATELYKQDKLGLQELQRTGRLKMLELKGRHMYPFSDNWFMENIIPYLLP